MIKVCKTYLFVIIVVISYMIAILLLCRYVWKKDGLSINSTRVNLNTVDGSLTIIGAQLEDEGVYQCLASNAYGAVFADISQLVMVSCANVSDISEPIQILYRKGLSLNLSCPYMRSVPGTTYSWRLKERDSSNPAYEPLSYSERIALDEKTGKV